MEFKAGDKVKVVSLVDTERRFGLDLFGYMKKQLNKIFTIEEVIDHIEVYLEETGCVWSKYDLALINNNILEIE